MKNRSLLFALSFLCLAPCALPQPGTPLDRTEILGRLAGGQWPSEIARLVRTRGLSFLPSEDFILSVRRAGGEGILAERLASAGASDPGRALSQPDSAYAHLAKCAESIHAGAPELAERECRASIEETPLSPWPLRATARTLGEQSALALTEEAFMERQGEIGRLQKRADTLAPDARDDVLPQFSPETLEDALRPAAGDSEGGAGLGMEEFGIVHQLVVPAGAEEGDSPPEDPFVPSPELLRRFQENPDLAAHRVMLAYIYAKAQRPEEARIEFQEAVRLEPDNTEIHARFALFYLRLGSKEPCLGELRESVRIVSSGARPRVALALALERFGRTSEAVSELENFLAVHPTVIEPSNALVDLYKRHHELRSAIAELRRSLSATRPMFAEEASFVDARSNDLRQFAYLLQDNHELRAAEEQFNLLLRYEPDNAGLRNDFGLVLEDEGRLDEAIAEFNEALGRAPDMPEAHHNLGVCLALQKNLDGAIRELVHALDLRPEDRDTRTYLSAVLTKAGDREGGTNQLQQATAEDPKDPAPHINLAFAFMQLGDDASAVPELKRALELKPDSAMAENDLAWIYLTAEDQKLRDPVDALKLARGAVRDSPDPDAAVLDTLAEALLQNGQLGEALATEQHALDLQPGNPEIQTRLKRIRNAAGLAPSPNQ